MKLFFRRRFSWKNINDNSKIKELGDIEDNELILDIGPKQFKK